MKCWLWWSRGNGTGIGKIPLTVSAVTNLFFFKKTTSVLYGYLPRSALSRFFSHYGKSGWGKWTDSATHIEVCLPTTIRTTGGWDNSQVPWHMVLNPTIPTKTLLFVDVFLIHNLKRGTKRRIILCCHVSLMLTSYAAITLPILNKIVRTGFI